MVKVYIVYKQYGTNLTAKYYYGYYGNFYKRGDKVGLTARY